MLKRRWHCLHGEMRLAPSKVCNIISVCVMLHNRATRLGLPPPECDDPQPDAHPPHTPKLLTWLLQSGRGTDVLGGQLADWSRCRNHNGAVKATRVTFSEPGHRALSLIRMSTTSRCKLSMYGSYKCDSMRVTPCRGHDYIYKKKRLLFCTTTRYLQ